MGTLLMVALSVFVCLCSAFPDHSGLGSGDNTWRFAILSDLHVGRSSEGFEQNKRAVAQVNRLAEDGGLEFLVVTGDITDSAMDWQWRDAKSLLDTLRVPLFPVFGNHDVFAHNDTWHEDVPTGDTVFARLFASSIANSSVVLSYTSPCWNPEHNISSWFQNYELRFDGPNGTLVFLVLDWNDRGWPEEHGVEHGGSPARAELHDFDGGTLRWFGDRIDNLPEDTTQVVIFQHHGFRNTPSFLPSRWGFTDEQRSRVRDLMIDRTSSHSVPLSIFWGIFMGHFHMWSFELAFPDCGVEWENFYQWETTAAMNPWWFGPEEGGKRGITLVTVDSASGTVVNVNRCC